MVAASSWTLTVAIPCAVAPALTSRPGPSLTPQVGVRSLVALHCDKVDVNLDSTKVSALARCLKVWTRSSKQPRGDEALRSSTRSAGSLLAGDELDPPIAPLQPPPAVLATDAAAAVAPTRIDTAKSLQLQKRLTFDDVFNHPIGDGEAAGYDLPESSRSMLWPTQFELHLASVSASLHLDSSEDGGGPTTTSAHCSQESGQRHRNGINPTEVFRFGGHGIEFSSSVNFVGGEGTGLFRRRGSSAALLRPVSASMDELVAATPTLQVSTYRFAICKLGACDEEWLDLPTLTPLGRLLQLAFRVGEGKESAPIDQSLRYVVPGKIRLGWGETIKSYLGSIDGGRDARMLNIALAGEAGNRRSAARGPLGASAASGRASSAEAAAASGAWPWLCSMPRSGDSSGSSWLEVQLQQETVLPQPSFPGPHPKRRARLLLRLRQSDVLLHLPTLAATARLLEALSPPRSAEATAGPEKEAGATAGDTALNVDTLTPGKGPPMLLPMVLLEVKPLRVLVPYARRRGSGWSAIDALQWSFTCSAASTTASLPMPFHVDGAVGPMDVATVSWQRRSRRRGTHHAETHRRGDSLVLQGLRRPQCYVCVPECCRYHPCSDPIHFCSSDSPSQILLPR